MPEVTPRQQPAFAWPPPDEPDLLGELTAAPQEPAPDDYFARVAQGSGSPFQPMQLGPKPTGLEVLLALAGGFLNAKTRRAAGRISETEERNQRAREAAKTLAQWRHQERMNKSRAIENRRNIIASRKPEKTLEQIRAASKAAAEGRREGAPLRSTLPRAKVVKPGPVMPELSSAASNLLTESTAFGQRGQTAQADSTRNLAGRIKDVHAAIRQAQTADEVRNIEIPDGTPESVMSKIRMAANNRLRQLGATR